MYRVLLCFSQQTGSNNENELARRALPLATTESFDFSIRHSVGTFQSGSGVSITDRPHHRNSLGGCDSPEANLHTITSYSGNIHFCVYGTRKLGEVVESRDFAIDNSVYVFRSQSPHRYGSLFSFRCSVAFFNFYQSVRQGHVLFRSVCSCQLIFVPLETNEGVRMPESRASLLLFFLSL